MSFLYTCLFLLGLYSVLVIYYWQAWKSIPAFVPEGLKPLTKISVVIPARNEEQHIGNLLRALEAQTFPGNFFEVIVVDDHSTDRTAEIVKTFQKVKLISLTENGINSYKKKAIETGIAAAAGEIIVATDADCLPPASWLETIAAFAEKNRAVFIAAPVSITNNTSVLQLFQAMDFMILQAITGAVVYKKQLSMCNGANIAYTKKVFDEVNGFSGIDTIASGDDMLLMYKIWRQYSSGVHYLKSREAIVNTAPQLTWKEFFQQRIRWASKANKYEDRRFLPVLLLVYFFNLSFILLLIAGCWYTWLWKWLLIFWIAKTLAELPLFISAARFFNKTSTVKWFFVFQPLHILYTVISGLLGQFGKYEWKGRKVR